MLAHVEARIALTFYGALMSSIRFFHLVITPDRVFAPIRRAATTR
jgi:hypothetical protein